MAKQRTFAAEAWRRKGKMTRRERFLSELDAVIPWRQLLDWRPSTPCVTDGCQPKRRRRCDSGVPRTGQTGVPRAVSQRRREFRTSAAPLRRENV